jgi:hypothetical protein
VFSIGRPAHFEPNRLTEQILERAQVAIRRPGLELGVARRAQLQLEVVAAIPHVEAGDHLRVAAVEAFRHAKNGGQQPDGAPPIGGQVGILGLRLLWNAAAVVERHERHHLDLLRIEPAEVAVLDQIVRMLVMPRVADVHADVVHQRRVLEPLALAIGAAVHRSASSMVLRRRMSGIRSTCAICFRLRLM